MTDLKFALQIGDRSSNGQVTIVDEDRLCYIVRSDSKGAVGLRTISKALLKEFVEYFRSYPGRSPSDARNALSGLSGIDKYEYGYNFTLKVMAEMVLNNEKKGVQIPKTPKTPLKSGLQIIYYGAPGGGKSYRVKKLIEEEKQAKERSFRVTFHPDTDYASFVGSYKPIMKGNDITYDFVPQIFTMAYIAAWNDLSHEYFIDIEEINRGNCAQIFGDLFQLLDRNSETGLSEYPIKADADLCNYLSTAVDEDGNPILKNKEGIKDGKLCLPANLSIVATMNTSDQSLFPMDSAFKRRWDWEYVPSTFKEEDNYNITIGNKTYKWHKFLKEVNDKIKDVTDSEDKQMGAYFIKKNVDKEAFKSKVMYYLWSEICKEEYNTQNNFFRSKIKVDGNMTEKEFSFNELYPDGEKLLIGFMKYLKVKPVEQAEEDDEEESEDE